MVSGQAVARAHRWFDEISTGKAKSLAESTHLSLDKDCPDPRPVMQRKIGKLITIPQVGGLHYRYERLAA